jgi:hypothetical protein
VSTRERSTDLLLLLKLLESSPWLGKAGPDRFEPFRLLRSTYRIGAKRVSDCQKKKSSWVILVML